MGVCVCVVCVQYEGEYFSHHQTFYLHPWVQKLNVTILLKIQWYIYSESHCYVVLGGVYSYLRMRCGILVNSRERCGWVCVFKMKVCKVCVKVWSGVPCSRVRVFIMTVCYNSPACFTFSPPTLLHNTHTFHYSCTVHWVRSIMPHRHPSWQTVITSVHARWG